MNVTDSPSPNFDSRSAHVIDMLVLHYTGMASGANAISRLRDPDAKVSAHYVVEEDGTIHRLVAENARAWHAGLSSWRGHSNINQRSIGIEIVNPGHEFGYRPFPPVQMKSVALLCRDIISRNQDIIPRNVVGHSDVAPERKEDPGELFDWKTLASLGVGLFPVAAGNAAHEKVGAEKLADFGYDMANPEKSITAFQRHYRPNKLTGQWDNECGGLLAALLAMV